MSEEFVFNLRNVRICSPSLDEYMQSIDMQIAIEYSEQSEYCPSSERNRFDHYLIAITIRGKSIYAPGFCPPDGRKDDGAIIKELYRCYRDYEAYNGDFHRWAQNNQIAASLGAWELIIRIHHWFKSNLSDEERRKLMFLAK